MTGHIRHGHAQRNARTPTYRSWHAMVQRCTDPNCEKFPRYGGRGVRVCDRWRMSFEAFLADMGPRPEGHTIDRVDLDGNYEPGNCRWAAHREQANNRSNNRVIEHRGRRLTLAQWAEELGMKASRLHSRLERGWALERALDPSIRRKEEPAPPVPPPAKHCRECDLELVRGSGCYRYCSARCRKRRIAREWRELNRDRHNERRRAAYAARAKGECVQGGAP